MKIRPKANQSVPAKAATVNGKTLPPGAVVKRSKANRKRAQREYASPQSSAQKFPPRSAKFPAWDEVGSRMPAGRGKF